MLLTDERWTPASESEPASASVKPDGNGRACSGRRHVFINGCDNSRASVYSGIVLVTVMSIEHIKKGDIVDLMVLGNWTWRQCRLWMTASEWASL